jgi:hypothetical protein
VDRQKKRLPPTDPGVMQAILKYRKIKFSGLEWQFGPKKDF